MALDPRLRVRCVDRFIQASPRARLLFFCVYRELGHAFQQAATRLVLRTHKMMCEKRTCFRCVMFDWSRCCRNIARPVAAARWPFDVLGLKLSLIDCYFEEREIHVSRELNDHPSQGAVLTESSEITVTRIFILIGGCCHGYSHFDIRNHSNYCSIHTLTQIFPPLSWAWQESNRYLSHRVHRSDVIAAWSGIRPLVRDPKLMDQEGTKVWRRRERGEGVQGS